MPESETDTITPTERAPRSRVARASRSARGSGAGKGGASNAKPAGGVTSGEGARRRARPAITVSPPDPGAAQAEPGRRKPSRRGDAAAAPAAAARANAEQEETTGPAGDLQDAQPVADGGPATAAEALAVAAAEEVSGPIGGEPAPESGDAGVAPAPEAEGESAAAPLLTCERTGPLRCTVKVQALKSVIGMTVAALPSRITLPVLSQVMLATEGEGHLRVTATDLDTTLTRRIPAVLDGGGAVLVSGRKLNEIVRELPDACTLNISLQGEEVVLVCDATRTRYRLPTLPVDEFPSPPRVRWDEDGFSVDPKVLAAIIERTSFAVSTEETRPILNGVAWELRPDGMTMVATNGHRLSAARVECAAGQDDLILLPRALALVARLAAEATEPLRVAHTQNHAGFQGDGWEVLTRLIEGPYPQWRQVVPKDNDRTLVVDRLAFTSAVRRMAIVAESQTHRIRLSLGGPTLAFSVANSGVGTGTEEIAVDYDGDPLEIGFNAQYLLEVLRYIPTGEVRLTFKGPERAATVHPVGEESGITHDVLLMPLRLQ